MLQTLKKQKKMKSLYLNKKVNKLEKIQEFRDNYVSENSFRFNLCDYWLLTVLKRHTSKEHKTETLGELPAHEENKSLTLSPTSDMRLESSNFNFNFLVKDEVCTQEVNF